MNLLKTLLLLATLHQGPTGTLNAVNANPAIGVSQLGSSVECGIPANSSQVTILIPSDTGSWSATLIPQISVDWSPGNANPHWTTLSNATFSPLGTSAAWGSGVDGTWTIPASGARFRVTCSAYSSGNINVSLSAGASIRSAGSTSTPTVQTLQGNPNTGSLLSFLNPALKTFIPPDQQNLVLDVNPAEQVYSDATFTTPQTVSGSVVASVKDQAGNANDITNSTTTNAPLLQLGANGIGNLPAIQFCDSLASPTKGFVLSTSTGPLTPAMQRSCTVYVVASTLAANDGGTAILARFGGSANYFAISNFGAVYEGVSAQIGSAAGLYGNQLAVYSFEYDGANMVTRINNKEVSTAASAPLWGGTADLTIGGFTNNQSTSFSSLAKIGRVLVYSDSHNKQQRDAITQQLMDVYGISQIHQIVVAGNSIDSGTAGYTVPWPTDLGFLVSGQGYSIQNQAISGQTTSQQAAIFGSLGTGAAFFGEAAGWVTGTATGVPTTTSIPAAGSSFSASVTGSTVMFTSGVNAGMGCKITSESATELFVAAPGFASAPVAGDTFVVFSQVMNPGTDYYIAHEITNDMLANGATDGPTANGGSATTCKAYLRYTNWCRAARAAGYKVIVATYTQRSTQGANYPGASFALAETDRLSMNAALIANWPSFADGLVDYSTDTRFATQNNNTWWLDGIHPTNAGAKVICGYFAQQIRLLSGSY